MVSFEFRSPGPEADWVRRRAKLFEAGSYPDKGVTVEPSHLIGLATNFTEAVPILVEHSDSPLQLGFLIEVTAEDNELFGVLSLSPEANALIEKCGADALSLGIASDLSRIREVSLVRNPRVPSARLFSDDLLAFVATEIDPIDFRAAYESLRAEQAKAKAAAETEQYLQDGRLLPSQRAAAQALFMSRETVVVDGKPVSVRFLAQELIRHNPRHEYRRILAPDPIDDGSHLLLPEEAAFYRRHFPEVKLSEIAKQKGGS